MQIIFYNNILILQIKNAFQVGFNRHDSAKTEFMRGPGRCDTSHLSDFNETWSKRRKHQEKLADKVGWLWDFSKGN